jgi:hypothetical protein
MTVQSHGSGGQGDRRPYFLVDPETGTYRVIRPMMDEQYALYRSPGETIERRPLSCMLPMQLGGARVLHTGDRNVAIVEAGRGNMAGHPEALTITLGQALAGFADESGEALASANQITSVKALVSWGTGGASFDAQVDWMHGTTLSIVASWVRVSATYPLSGDSDNPSPDVSLTAGVGYGDIGESEGARFTQSIGTLGVGAASPYFPIPAFATDFILLSSSAAAPAGFLTEPAQIQISSSTDAAPTFTNAFLYTGGSNADGQEPRTFPIFSGARFLRVRNSGANTAKYTVVYNLTL